MRLLLDSSGAGVIVALADSEGVIVERWHESGSLLSRDIGRAAGEVLGELAIARLEQIVVGLGPGTFIGTRIAISYANGLAAASGRKIRGVNSLAALASVYCKGGCAVVRDARRGDLYYHNPRERDHEQQTRLLPIEKLTEELHKSGIATVVMEQAGSTGGQQRTVEWVAKITADAGLTLVLVAGVPAEGLRRLGSLADAREFVEPIYLRGFL